MKYIKITIKKDRNKQDTQTNFVYPKSFDAAKFNIVHYQNEGLGIEYAIATVNDKFNVSEGLEEITKKEAKQLISDYIINDRDIKDDILLENGKTRDDVILNKQNIL